MMVTTPGHAPPCVVCDYRGEMRPYFPTQELVQCPHCGLVFYRHFQAPTEQLYSEDYFRGAEYRDYVADKGVLQRNFRKRLPTLLRHALYGK